MKPMHVQQTFSSLLHWLFDICIGTLCSGDGTYCIPTRSNSTLDGRSDTTNAPSSMKNLKKDRYCLLSEQPNNTCKIYTTVRLSFTSRYFQPMSTIWRLARQHIDLDVLTKMTIFIVFFFFLDVLSLIDIQARLR
mmetsp:Transcript_12577/g.43819  ORF Transcript_12577/g.43819 Transcript_12577/m.43819 type:complete len:135 (-) Transcript_12577:859-1263(-)